MLSRPSHSAEFYHDKVMSLTKLPTLPVIAMELMQVTRDDKLSVNQILPIIEKDPPLALKVLKIANSAYYGLNSKVESLRHALVIIGMKELSDLAVSFSVFQAFNQEESEHAFEWKQLWEHSAACGHVSQLLQTQLNLNINSSPYALGLLHDIGKLILYKLDGERYLKSLDLSRAEGIYSYEAEQQLFGVDHMQVGGWIAEKWQLPPILVAAIGAHHHPDLVEDEELKIGTALVQLSDLVCNLQSLNFGTDYLKSIPREEQGWLILQSHSDALAGMDFERFVLGIEDELETIRHLVALVSE